MMRVGERDSAKVVAAVREGMADVDIDYVELVDVETLEPVERIAGTVMLAVAAYVGPTRLIDNIKFEVHDP
jgi:pantoate--beta-alanine ligase